MIWNESNRHTRYLNHLPQTSDVKNNSLSRSVSDAFNLSSKNSNTSRSSLKARKLEDSLNGVMLEKMRRKRRNSSLSLSESNRHTWSLNRLPQTSEVKNNSLSRSVSDAFNLSSTNSNTSRSSLKVRTLEDSLKGVMLEKMRRKGGNSSLSLSNKNVNLGRSSNSSSSERGNRTVQFSRVMIREYPVMPGDNPAVSDGPPLTLDWTISPSFSVAIDRFEKFREGNRRGLSQMKMSMQTRVAFLLEQGYDGKIIMTAAREAAAIRHQRLKTLESLTLSDKEGKVDSTRKIISNPFRRKENREDKKRQRYRNMNMNMNMLSCV